MPGHSDICNSLCCCLLAQLCLTLCDPMDWSMPGFPVLHHLLEFVQTHVPCIGSMESTNGALAKSLISILKSYFIKVSVQFSWVALSCPTLCDPMNCSMRGLPVHHQLPESTQTHVHWASDAIQPSHPLSSPSPPALSLSQHQGLFKWVNSLHQLAKVLEFQLQYQSFQ